MFSHFGKKPESIFKLTEEINKHLQQVLALFHQSKNPDDNDWQEKLYKDWGRSLINEVSPVAFDNNKIIASFDDDTFNDADLETQKNITEEIINLINANLAGVHHDIIQYILEHGTQHKGFANMGEDIITATYFMNQGILVNNKMLPRKQDYIRNKDGSVTYIERYQINVIGKMDMTVRKSLAERYESDKDPSLIGVTISTIKRNESGQIEHTLDSTEIILLDENLNNQGQIQLFEDNFDWKDANLSLAYDKTAKETEDLLDSEVSLHIENNNTEFTKIKLIPEKLNSISEISDFNANTAAVCLNDIFAITQSALTDLNPANVNWLMLESIINEFEKILRQHTPDEDDFFKIIEQSKHSDAVNEILSSQQYLQLTTTLLPKITLLADEQNFQLACKNLESSTRPDNSDSKIEAAIKIAGRETLYYAKLAKKENMVPAEELHMLTRFVNDTTEVVKDPTDDSKITALRDDIDTAISGKYRRWGKLIGGAMLVTFGILVIAAAITLAVTTAGISTPLSGLLSGIAVSIILKGVGIGTAVALSVGGLTFGAWGGSMFGVGRKENVRKSGEFVLEKATAADKKALEKKKKYI